MADKKTYTQGEIVGALVESIDEWGLARNITAEGGATVLTQMSKMMEEFAEFMVTYNELQEVCNGFGCSLEELHDHLIAYEGTADKTLAYELLNQLDDDFGDMLVCIIQAIRLSGSTTEACLYRAWEGIKFRKGKMVDGKFVKETDKPMSYHWNA